MLDNKDTHETLKPGTHVEVLSKKQVDGKSLCGTIITAAQTYLVLMSWSTILVWITGLIPKTNYRLSLNRFASIRRPGRSKSRPFRFSDQLGASGRPAGFANRRTNDV